jgi:hypothetical protein
VVLWMNSLLKRKVKFSFDENNLLIQD